MKMAIFSVDSALKIIFAANIIRFVLTNKATVDVGCKKY
jgi:hypothetical protein